ncbi:MAG: PorV/PorQ family protein, partial [Gemmatimonadota bacterium]|nr:PorV/PorQ family protein [Gemmatimonadota bacterium]
MRLIALPVFLIIAAAAGLLRAQAADMDTGLKPDVIGGRISGFARLGTSAAEFLTIPTSARGTALGGAYTALGNDLGALFWNPAGLGDITGPTFQFTNVNMNEDFSINFAAGAIPFNDGAGVAAAFISFFTTQPEEITTIYQPEGTGAYFDSYSSVAGGSIAYNISDRFAAGVSLKWIHEDIWDITSNAFSMDVGANYHTMFMNRT